MSKSGVFAFQRDGQLSVFVNGWASAFLFREVVYGPEALEQFASHCESVDPDESKWLEKADGIWVDFDANQMLWNQQSQELQIPAILSRYNRLLEISWPGFEFKLVDGPINFLSGIPFRESQGNARFENRVENVL